MDFSKRWTAPPFLPVVVIGNARDDTVEVDGRWVEPPPRPPEATIREPKDCLAAFEGTPSPLSADGFPFDVAKQQPNESQLRFFHTSQPMTDSEAGIEKQLRFFEAVSRDPKTNRGMAQRVVVLVQGEGEPPELTVKFAQRFAHLEPKPLILAVLAESWFSRQHVLDPRSSALTDKHEMPLNHMVTHAPNRDALYPISTVDGVFHGNAIAFRDTMREMLGMECDLPRGTATDRLLQPAASAPRHGR